MVYKHPDHQKDHLPVFLTRYEGQDKFLLMIGNPEPTTAFELPLRLRNIGNLLQEGPAGSEPRAAGELLTEAGKKTFILTIMAALRAVAIETGGNVKLKSEGAVMDRIHIWIQFSKTPGQVDSENPDFDDLFNRVAMRIRKAVAAPQIVESLQMSKGFGCDFADKDPGLELRDAKFSSMKNTRGVVVAEIQTCSGDFRLVAK